MFIAQVSLTINFFLMSLISEYFIQYLTVYGAHKSTHICSSGNSTMFLSHKNSSHLHLETKFIDLKASDLNKSIIMNLATINSSDLGVMPLNHPYNKNIFYKNIKSDGKKLKKSKKVVLSLRPSIQPFKSASKSKENVISSTNKSVTIVTNHRRYICTVPDYYPFANTTLGRSRRYVLQGSKWKKLQLTWALVKPSKKVSVNGIVEREFERALKVWEKVSKLTFTKVHPSSKVDILVEFHVGEHNDGYSFDGDGGTLAHAFYPGSGIGGDVHFDDDEDFNLHADVVKTRRGVSLFITAAHELGHSLGLRHSNDDNSLMAPFYQEFGDNFTLPRDDVKAIQALYGNPEYLPTSLPKDITTTTTRASTTTTSTTTTASTRKYKPPHETTKRYYPPIRTTTTRIPPPRRDTTTRWTPRPPIKMSNPCTGEFDAVVSYRGSLLFFRDIDMWLSNSYTFRALSLDLLFQGVNYLKIDRVDAAFPLERSKGIALSSGPKIYFLFRTQFPIEKSLRDIGVTTAERLDAAWRWGHNGHVYLFSGEQYWRLDSDYNVEKDYPRHIATWRDLPANISGAVTFKGITYFFSGSNCWEFDNLEMRAKASPFNAASFWLGCPHSSFPAQIISKSKCSLCLPKFYAVVLITLVSFFT